MLTFRTLTRLVAFLLFFGVTPAAADGHQTDSASETSQSALLGTYMNAMCGLTGRWSGEIEIHGADGLASTGRMDATYYCLGTDTFLVEENIFFEEDGANLETLKVSFATNKPNEFQTSYFSFGEEKLYFFIAEDASYKEETNWSVTRGSSEGTLISDGKPAILRYVRTRNGSTLTLLKEVQFYEESPEWHLRTRLVQTLQE